MIYYEYFNGGIEITRCDTEHLEQLWECEAKCSLFALLHNKLIFLPYVQKIKLPDLITFYDMVEDKMLETFGGNYLVNKSSIKRVGQAKNTVEINKVVTGNKLFPEKHIDFGFTPLVTTKGWGIQVCGSVKPTLSMLEYPRKSYVKNFWSHEMSDPNCLPAHKLLQIVFHDDCGLSVGDLTNFEIELLTALVDQSINKVRDFINNGKL